MKRINRAKRAHLIRCAVAMRPWRTDNPRAVPPGLLPMAFSPAADWFVDAAAEQGEPGANVARVRMEWERQFRGGGA